MRAHRTPSTTTAVVVLAFLALLGTGTHTVARGETLGAIAARYGTTTAQLAATNGLADPNHIEAGDRLLVPSRRPAPPTRRPAGRIVTHVVVRGDTLGGLARRYGVPAAQIVDANGLTGDRIYVGQQLRLLPVGSPSMGRRPDPVDHTVEPGETLTSIAKLHRVTVRALREVNNLSDPDVIRVGTTLIVPVGDAPTTHLVCPIRGPLRHVNDWGFPRSGGRFHEGNDLFARRGTPVVAITGGHVQQMIGRIGGKQVKLVGDDGVTYYYTHLDSFGPAGRVEVGAVIGTVGTSGNAAGGPAHVHFEVHPGGGAAVNPYPRVAALC